jgi:CRISPR-associated protein (TIGR03984 family)
MSDFAKVIKDVPLKDDQVPDWIKGYLENHKYLLAFADDGVIWGKIENGTFITSHQVDASISPPLRGKTLQQAFIFDEKDEIRLYRDELNGWQARQVTDGNVFFKESQVLWGDRAYPSQSKFTHVFNARQQGLDHIVPIEVENKQLDADEQGHQCIRLDIHHSVAYNENGEAYVAISRLVGIRIGEKSEEVLI